ARALGLVTADKPESQEICFIPDDDYRGFLRARIPDAFRAGPIVDTRGAVLGQHSGIADFTVGQRRGLGLSGGRALYVTELDPEPNAVVVGGRDEVEPDQLVAEQVNWIAQDGLTGPIAVEAKVRHGHVPAGALVRPSGVDATGRPTAKVAFEQPQRGV